MNGKYQALPNVKQVNGDSWIDKTGKTHKGRPDAAEQTKQSTNTRRTPNYTANDYARYPAG